jgi:hypothetical protein
MDFAKMAPELARLHIRSRPLALTRLPVSESADDVQKSAGDPRRRARRNAESKMEMWAQLRLVEKIEAGQSAHDFQ